MTALLEDKGIVNVDKVIKTVLSPYIPYLEKAGRATTAISRILASMKTFFHYEFSMGIIKKDPAELLKAPRVEEKAPSILSMTGVECLSEQLNGGSSKDIWDKAMLELLHATGTRVIELISLEVSDMNLGIGSIICQGKHKVRTVPFDKTAKQALIAYMEKGREVLLKGIESPWLFTSCDGEPMSRQGFWRTIKYYGERAGIETGITFYTTRRSFVTHLTSGGTDIHTVQAILGHPDMVTTQMYISYLQQADPVRNAYTGTYPKKQGK